MSGKEKRTVEGRQVARTISIERAENADGETVYRASLSSETPVQDFPWSPPLTLSHTRNAVDMSRAENGLPLLDNHDGMYSSVRNMLGRIHNIGIERKRLVGELVFSEANPEAQTVRAMVDEGTITDMSIRADIHRVKRIEENGETVRIEALEWTPVEASVVPVGADGSVGIGRSKSNQADESANGDIAMGDKTQAEKTSADNDDDGDDVATQVQRTRVEPGRQAIDADRAVKLEENRIQAIRSLGEINNVGHETVDAWITQGYTLDQVADNLLEIHRKRGESGAESKGHIGLSDNETQSYSLCRAILAAHSENWKDAGFELECHKAVAERTGKLPDKGTFYVPLEVQRRAMPLVNGAVENIARKSGLTPAQIVRDLNVAAGGAGGFLTQTTNVGFDELMRNISFAFRMGVQRLTGLRDNVAIPRQSAAATAEWLTSETDSPTESQQTFVQLLMTPKTVSAYTELSRQLLLQATMDAEGLVNSDLAAVAALAVDAAVLNGSGASGQPEGLDNTTGIGAVTGTSLDYAGVLNFQEDVAAGNIMPMAGGYVTTPAVASLMMQRVKFTGTASPLWEGNLWEGNMVGFNAMSTNQVAAANMYFGDWSKAIVGEWGVLEVETNPYANFPAGIIGVRAMYSVDVGVRYPAAFSRAQSIT